MSSFPDVDWYPGDSMSEDRNCQVSGSPDFPELGFDGDLPLGTLRRLRNCLMNPSWNAFDELDGDDDPSPRGGSSMDSHGPDMVRTSLHVTRLWLVRSIGRIDTG